MVIWGHMANIKMANSIPKWGVYWQSIENVAQCKKLELKI